MKKIIFFLILSFFVITINFSRAQTALPQPDSLIKGELTTIYYYAADGYRYVFPNNKTFGSWFSDFGAVTTVSDQVLSQIPLKGNVTYRPGVRMIKIQTVPKVYVVDKGGKLRWIKTEELAKKLYGDDWNKKIDDVPDEFFTNYIEGPPIESETEYDPFVAVVTTQTINQDRGIKETATALRATTKVGSLTIPAIPAIPKSGEKIRAIPAIPALPFGDATSTTSTLFALPVSTTSTIPALPAIPAVPAEPASLATSTPFVLPTSGTSTPAIPAIPSTPTATSTAPVISPFQTATSTISLIDTIAPSIPTNLYAGPVFSSTQISFAWSPSTDNVGVVGYKIYRNGTFLTNTTSTPSGAYNEVFYTDSELTAGTSYTYKVAAYDAAGNVSAQSNQISATTKSATSTSTPTPTPSTPIATSISHTCGTPINVPQDTASIQVALNSACSGDTILVSAGTYYENLTVPKSGLTLKGASGTSRETVIVDGGGKDTVLSATQITSFTVEGMTFRNASKSGSMPGGAAIHLNPIWSGTFTARNLILRDSSAGFVLWNMSSGSVTLERSLITGNTSEGINGGNIGSSQFYITNNTIANNGRSGYYDFAGGGYRTFRNNLITGNGWYGINPHSQSNRTILYNNVWNNAKGNYYNSYSGDPTSFTASPGTGELSIDPQYVDVGIDYHLQSTSPVINVGDPSTVYNDPNGSRSDMGAYYFAGVIPPPPPPVPTNVQAITSSNAQSHPPEIRYYLTFNYTLQSTTQSFNIYRKTPTDASFVKYTYSAQTPVNASILPLPVSGESNLYHRYLNQWEWWTTLFAPAPDTAVGEYQFYVTAVDASGVESSPSEIKLFKLYSAPVITSPVESSTVSSPFAITVPGDPTASNPTYNMLLYKHITGDTAWVGISAPLTNFTYAGQALNTYDNPHRLVVWFTSGIYDRSLFGTSVFNISTTASSTASSTVAKIKLPQKISLSTESTSALKVRLTKHLERGSFGDEVRLLQEALAQSPEVYPEGLVTGYFGSLTKAAVKKFQKKYGLAPVGVVGPQTRAILNQN